MYLIVGLGNPESDYSNTRHNMGFDVVNKIANKYNIEVNKKKFKGLIGIGNIDEKKVIILKPQTFMNLSGESVIEVTNYYQIPLEKVVVVYDDIDLEPGTIRIRKSGGPGTHNGMKSVIENLKSEVFPRVRVGIGTPVNESLIEYVLGAIPKEEKEKLEKGVDLASKAIELIVKENIDIAMNKLN